MRGGIAVSYYTHTLEVPVLETGAGTKGSVSWLQVGPEARGAGEEGWDQVLPPRKAWAEP